jgi:hypothetical protein
MGEDRGEMEHGVGRRLESLDSGEWPGERGFPGYSDGGWNAAWRVSRGGWTLVASSLEGFAW